MSRLEEISVQFRKREVTRNSYNQNDEYQNSHPNALSDGDELGKGEFNGSIGGISDIKARDFALTRNKYNANDPYNDSNA